MSGIGERYVPLSRDNVQAIQTYIRDRIAEAKAELARTVAEMPGVKATDTDLRLECLKLAASVLVPKRVAGAAIDDVINDAAKLYAFTQGQTNQHLGE